MADEVDITQLLANYLPSHGFRVSQVHHGDALIQLMERDPADLLRECPALLQWFPDHSMQWNFPNQILHAS